MITIQQLVVQYLRQNNYTSKANPITAKDLAIHFGISDGEEEVEIRNVIREAIAQNELIGSNNRGFYLIGTLSELEENLDSLESRARNILQRRRNMMNSWNSKNPTNPTSRTNLNVR